MKLEFGTAEEAFTLKGIKILVVDSQHETLEMAQSAFDATGAEVRTSTSGQDGLRQLYHFQPDLMILGWNLSDLDGLEVCRLVRQVSDVPIILLSRHAEDESVVQGLSCGAVDYVTKPFSPIVLIARAQAALRHTTPACLPERPYAYADDHLTIDLEKRLVLAQGKKVELTPTEFELLAYLVNNADRVVTHQQILDSVWGWEYRDSVDYVHIYVSRLRRKLEENPDRSRRLKTVRGVGYTFERQH